MAVLVALGSLEYKFHVAADTALDFVWQTDGGALVAPFTGAVGWYWQNEGPNPVVITPQTRGEYRVLGIR
jgi:hypothetical protein